MARAGAEADDQSPVSTQETYNKSTTHAHGSHGSKPVLARYQSTIRIESRPDQGSLPPPAPAPAQPTRPAPAGGGSSSSSNNQNPVRKTSSLQKLSILCRHPGIQ
ncbi:hypothetical protein PLESTM_000825500 [Pleodorina starrii]|nr:hypothetical protein PLESTM_000825500 [Pleodorina starrii]